MLVNYATIDLLRGTTMVTLIFSKQFVHIHGFFQSTSRVLQDSVLRLIGVQDFWLPCFCEYFTNNLLSVRLSMLL